MSEKFFLSLTILNDNLAGYSIPGYLFPSQDFEYNMPLPSGLQVSTEKSADFFFFFLRFQFSPKRKTDSVFSLAVFRIFSLVFAILIGSSSSTFSFT